EDSGQAQCVNRDKFQASPLRGAKAREDVIGEQQRGEGNRKNWPKQQESINGDFGCDSKLPAVACPRGESSAGMEVGVDPSKRRKLNCELQRTEVAEPCGRWVGVGIAQRVRAHPGDECER